MRLLDVEFGGSCGSSWGLGTRNEDHLHERGEAFRGFA